MLESESLICGRESSSFANTNYGLKRWCLVNDSNNYRWRWRLWCSGPWCQWCPTSTHLYIYYSLSKIIFELVTIIKKYMECQNDWLQTCNSWENEKNSINCCFLNSCKVKNISFSSVNIYKQKNVYKYYSFSQ